MENSFSDNGVFILFKAIGAQLLLSERKSFFLKKKRYIWHNMSDCEVNGVAHIFNRL